MSPKKTISTQKASQTSPSKSVLANQTTFLGRDGLGAYIAAPDSFPSSRVIYHNSKWVVINDLFPKSSIHLLLLSRDPAKQLQHPFVAFEDLSFLEEVKEEVRKLRKLTAVELRRRFGKYSKLEQERQKLVEAEGKENGSEQEQTNVLPPGRDWSQSIISGIHAGPSMNHLHVHVISVDRHSQCMKHRKHYNSFSTPFFIDVEDFPLDSGDARRHPGGEGYLKRDFVCWRCRQNFGNKFTRLKQHLEEEFLAWRSE